MPTLCAFRKGWAFSNLTERRGRRVRVPHPNAFVLCVWVGFHNSPPLRPFANDQRLVSSLAYPQAYMFFDRKRLPRIDRKLRFQRKRVSLERNREMGIRPQEGAHE